jgi:3-oxoacyl-[acyl-carrier protein] reductase
MPNLTGKTALVTGASRGMGRASALALAAAGAQVLVHYGRGAKEADGVVAEIRKDGGRADATAADLAAADGPHKLAKQVRSIIGDRLDILVANAGISKAAIIEETTVEDFDKLFAVNVRAPFFLVQQLLPIMSKGSSIVFVSSLAARAVVGTAPAYAATKGGRLEPELNRPSPTPGEMQGVRYGSYPSSQRPRRDCSGLWSRRPKGRHDRAADA